MNDERGVGSGEARVDFAEPFGQVGIEAGDKRNACGAGKPSRGDSGDGDTEQEGKRRDEPASSDAHGHVTDRLHDTLQNADVLLADGEEQRKRRADIEKTGKHSTPRDGTGQIMRGIFNFVTHDRGKFQTYEAETNHPERVEHKLRARGDLKTRRAD